MDRKFIVGDVVDAKRVNVCMESKPIDRISGKLFYVGNLPFFEAQLTLIKPFSKLYKGQFDDRKLIIDDDATEDQCLVFMNFNLALSRIMEK